MLGEDLPKELRTGFEAGKNCDPRWVFVAEREGSKVALLMACPAHLLVILMRLATTPEAQPTDVRQLLIHAMREFKSRGFSGYMSWLDPERPEEQALISVIKTAGGFVYPAPQVCCAGAL